MVHETEIERHVRYGFRDGELTLRYRDWKNRRRMTLLKPNVVISNHSKSYIIKEVQKDKLIFDDDTDMALSHLLGMLKARYWHIGF